MLVQAMKQPKIREIPDRELMGFASSQIVQCYFMVGYQNYDQEGVTILAAKLVSDLFENFSFLTKEEVVYCFDAGIKGEFGEFTGINFLTLHRWLNAYKSCDQRYRAKTSLQQETEQKTLPTVSEDYKREREDAFLQNVFRQYKAGYPLDRLYPVKVYQTLQARGVIRHTPEEKWAAVERVKRRGGIYSSSLPREDLIKSKAMEWLLGQEFDRMEKLRL